MESQAKKFDLVVMLSSEFPYAREYQTCMKNLRERLKDKSIKFQSIKTVVGCSNTILGEGFVFFDNLVLTRNISGVDLSECDLIGAIMAEITEVSLHELLHFCGRHREKKNVFMTCVITCGKKQIRKNHMQTRKRKGSA
jgi:hypothetical protein